MQAIGLIETKGLITAIEAADTMLKSSDVSIVEKTYVGGGLVTVIVTGDVGSVRAAIEAGSAAVKKINPEYLISDHIMPRPSEELKTIIGPKATVEVLKVITSNEDVIGIEEIQKEDIKNTKVEKLENKDVGVQSTAPQVEDIKVQSKKDVSKIVEEEKLVKGLVQVKEMDLDKLHKNDVDKLVSEDGIEKAILILDKLKVVKLRNLAREYEDFVITGRTISKADKKLLIIKFKAYYEKNSKI
ncbi:BMC domain-containing protein [Clostridium algidicarnis]|uniref:BMC domain-containing protein n=1 Tax=Clostridium algidicarnis TaxID=37659 RepID=UPI00162ABF48|nr:BMC domain-containing protein [Clostridium algidicarnis]MBB6631110.1 BMC domain-containing protein [Clostridium algidicarnis]MBU3194328.1 BMC domain-containing protein [Clostridium algidicarnis]MBU3203885.1 BMC domain-containing protein [Clostridium algidicarnis]MBU3212039.1 BMC domain-containing protein [Clostridium algidicarnis]MBU3221455.1 BMC domain-containing protein [Clostridium algidicarnis]